jgi:hypothetical protein
MIKITIRIKNKKGYQVFAGAKKKAAGFAPGGRRLRVSKSCFF